MINCYIKGKYEMVKTNVPPNLALTVAMPSRPDDRHLATRVR